MTKRPKILESKLFWVGILYFAEGFPFGIFYDVLPVYFRQMGVDLREIGFLSLLGLAWTVKFLWAPAVDYYRHHRRWMLVADLGIAAVLLFLSAEGGFGVPVQTAIVLFAILSATNDIAIDGYTVELLNKRELGLANGVRNGMYRVGVLTVGVILIMSHYLSWTGTYVLAAAFMILLGLLCLAAPGESRITVARQRFFLGRLFMAALAIVALFAAVDFGILSALAPRMPQQQTLAKGLAIVLTVITIAIGATLILRRTGDIKQNGSTIESTPLFGALIEMLKRPYILAVLFFVLTYKLGDASMGPMVRPFWVDAGFTAQDIGLVSVIIGLALSIAGGLVGGWIIDRVGIFNALWILGVFQAVSNLGYVWAASIIPLGTPAELSLTHRAIMYFASVGESFTGGLGSVAFLAFMMAIVNKKFAAAEYALLSSLFAITRHLSGFASGFGAHYLGYTSYFLLTFFLSFPAYLLLPWIKQVLDQSLSRAK